MLKRKIIAISTIISTIAILSGSAAFVQYFSFQQNTNNPQVNPTQVPKTVTITYQELNRTHTYQGIYHEIYSTTLFLNVTISNANTRIHFIPSNFWIVGLGSREGRIMNFKANNENLPSFFVDHNEKNLILKMVIKPLEEDDYFLKYNLEDRTVTINWVKIV
jgi:hypothetical protein